RFLSPPLPPQPGNYEQTIRRTDQSFQACNDIMSCFLERAKVEKHYAQQLSEWSSKWKTLSLTSLFLSFPFSPLYGSLMRAWQCFFSSAEHLSILHFSISQSLDTEEGDKMKSWQKKTFTKKIFCGFLETHENEIGFARAQKPWAKRLGKLDKACNAYHKACYKEQVAIDREMQAKENTELCPEKLKKIQDARENASEEKDKVRKKYEKVLEDLTSYTPHYMEEMEAIFDKSQEEERKRISFLKQALYIQYMNILTHSICLSVETDDLRWWKNNHGPGMPTDWPMIEVYNCNSLQ
uniref:Zgc:91999 n=1 Tax=Hucho hucho TaxID=62062 RepID=A0A4W5R0J5_9TELE